jgi:hypothetical protein
LAASECARLEEIDMSRTLETILVEAERAGLVAAGHASHLSAFLAARGVEAVGRGGPETISAMTRPDTEALEAKALEDSEQPRFVRGFHDILITIGILVLTAGVVGVLGLPLAALPVVIILSEIFVRRQRLALPSVVLSVLAVGLAMSAVLFVDLPIETNSILCAAVMTVSAGLYHMRYKTPISLAGIYFGIAFLIFVTTVLVLFRSTTLETAATTGDIGLALVSTLIAVGLFAVAMWYDLSDPARQTRRSDVAFWLHLGAAPLLLHTLIGLLSGGGMMMAGFNDAAAELVVASVVVLMVVGLVIDRRAFVTSGLLSLGIALGTILRNRVAELLDMNIWLVAIAVGIIVLSIGLFWQPLRRLLLGTLPPALTRRLPPVR